MNIDILLPVISKALGRDLTEELTLFYRARNAVGVSLNKQGQIYVTENWKRIVDFMETPEGRQAIVTFIDSWVRSSIPKSLGSEPIPEPAAIPSLEPEPVRPLMPV